jgi:hypothetical protein
MPRIASSRLHRILARGLRKAKLPFREHVGLSGTSPDFVLETPEGKTIVVVVQPWAATPTLVQRATDQILRYDKAKVADAVFLVLEGLKRNRPDRGLLTLEGAVRVLSDIVGTAASGAASRASPEPQTPLIFAAMPFHKKYQNTYWQGMVPAAEAVGAQCKRLDMTHFSDDIIPTMKSWIRHSIAVIADLSGSNPNVLYEAGYAHALNKPAVHLCSTPLNKLPFDVSTWPTLEYKVGAVPRLAPRLIATLEDLLGVT